MPYPKKLKVSAAAPKTGEGKRNLFLRRKHSNGFDWSSVDPVGMKAAIHLLLGEGCAVMLTAAQGGRGVCLKIFDGEDKITEYATDHVELNEMFDQLIDQLESDSEDIREVMRMTPRELPEAK